MALRLPHVLVLMALILGAGLVGVAVLAPSAGVPGIVVVDAPWASPTEMAGLAERWPGAAFAWLPAGRESSGPLGPFDPAWAAGRADRGDLTALYSLDARLRRDEASRDGAGRPAWRVVVDSLPSLTAQARVDWAVSSAADLLQDQGGTRPFAVGLAFDDGRAPPGDGAPAAGSVARPLDTLVTPLMEALLGLPTYRRSTLVVLGGEDRDGSGRLVLRIDPAGRPAPGGDRGTPGLLADLLEVSP